VASPAPSQGRGTGAVAGRVYGSLYEPATTPGEAFSAMLIGKRHEGEPRFQVSESGQDAGVLGAGAADLTSPGLFVVERRLPKINDHQLTVLQAALTSAASRLSARGDGVRLVGSIFLARQERLLSLFTAESLEAVLAVNVASLVPFASIEPAVQLPGPDPS
jgi:hypothetical protein